jgi:dephospho-CoA kinase
MYHYAVTGNIGSGKSTVCRQFERMDIPVYYADAAAKRLMHEDQALIAGLKAAFGAETYLPDGTLNRPWLAKKAFSDDKALATLNNLVHPAVHRDAAAWRSRQTGAYTLYEAAIVFELGRQVDFAGVIVVAAPENVRKTRVMKRDGVDEAAFLARAAKQWPDDKKEAAADFLIVNDGRRLLLPQILRLHRKLTTRQLDNLTTRQPDNSTT